MPAGITLSELRTRLRAELRHSLTPALGQNTNETFNYYLNRTQEELAMAYSWPLRDLYLDFPTVANQRYYDLPAGAVIEQVTDLWQSNGTEWARLGYDITPDILSVYNSDNGQTGYPAQRWRWDVTKKQIELWPVPNQSGTIRMRAYKMPAWMVGDSDMCELDPTSIVLFAAAEILTGEKGDAAQIKQQKGMAHLKRILGAGLGKKRQPFLPGPRGPGDLGREPLREGLDYIASGRPS